MKKPAPLDPELRALLDAEADFPPEAPALEARVWQKVTAIVAAPPGGEGGGAAPAGPAALSKYGTVALIAFLAGGIAGAGVYHALTRSSSEQAPTPAPTAAAVAAPIDTGREQPRPEPPRAEEPASVAKNELAVAPIPAAASAPSASSSAKALAPSTTNLARERAIIEVARTAVARGRTSAALDAIERHAREFPKGQLVEEREGLRVIALARSGQSEDARKKAAAFRKRYPSSVLLPATEAALEPKPE